MGLSTIQWTDYTFNPWIGCRKVAPECANCYAETLDRNRYSKTLAPGTKANPVSHWGRGPRHRTKTWGDPVKWNLSPAALVCPLCGDEHMPMRWATLKANEHKAPLRCMRPGCDGKVIPRRARVFCASLADWLDDENVPIEWFADLLKLIHDTPNLDWLLLTKRPQNWRARVEAVHDTLQDQHGHSEGDDPLFDLRCWLNEWLYVANLKQAKCGPANVWIGVSAGADQSAALDIPARVHFLSCEPMLHQVNAELLRKFDWVIFGGESGSKARPCNLAWIDEGLALCRTHRVAGFVKQLGAKPYWSPGDGLYPSERWPAVGPLKLKDSHGGDMDEWPEDLRVREFPTVR